MDPKALRKLAQRVMGAELANRSSDPRFYAGLNVLPNPDPILRQMGQADLAYDAIMSDAHVIGELRTVKAKLQNFKFQVSGGDETAETAEEKRAADLCRAWIARKPAPGMRWPDVFWNMGTAVLRGFRVHELVWNYVDGALLPTIVLDRPNRRFKFDNDNQLRYLTRSAPMLGEECDPYRFVLTRHMPSFENPYGQALLSSCFWPYTFKHGGFKFLYQFCERFGLPWPIGKYPRGTPIGEQQELLDALLDMLQSGAAAIPDGDAVELKSISVSGDLVQEAIIHLCNREMSKALTSQTLATEVGQSGSRAVAQVHADRQDDVGESDRAMIESTMSDIFELITVVNFGDGVPAPTFEYYNDETASKDRAEVYEIATRLSARVSAKAFHEEMGIPMAGDDEEVLNAAPAANTATAALQPGSEFAAHCPQCGGIHQFAAAETRDDDGLQTIDDAIDRNWIKPAADMLAQYEKDGKTLREFFNDLPTLYGNLSDDEVHTLFTQAMQLEFAQGMDGQR